jgi:hypothetical protein
LRAAQLKRAWCQRNSKEQWVESEKEAAHAADKLGLVVCSTLKSRSHSAANRQRAQQLAWRWIREKWPRFVSGSMDLEGGRLERSNPGARLIVSSANEGTSWMAEVTEVARDSRQWRTRVVVAEGVGVDILAVQTACSRSGPAPVTVAPPKLLAAWVEALDVHDATEPAFGQPWWVTDETQAAEFLDHVLDGQRALPVIALANKGTSRYFGVDPEALAKSMQGMAHVACVTQEARDVLKRRLGPRLAPLQGAARIYGAGLDDDESEDDHPLVRQPGLVAVERVDASLASFRERIIRAVCASSARRARVDGGRAPSTM